MPILSVYWFHARHNDGGTGGTQTAWNRKATGYTLSNGNLTVTSPNDAAVGGADTDSVGNVHSTGKRYFEIVATTITAAGDWAGGASMAATNPPTNNLTDGLDGAGKSLFRASGTIHHLATGGSAAGVTLAQNDIVGVAIDFDSGKIWFAKNNTWILSGDPGAGTNATKTFTANWYAIPLCSSDNSAGVSAWTLGTTDPTCTYAPPTGFSYWDA